MKIPDCFSQTLDNQPITLIDVGASGGIPKHWKALNRHLKVVGFEPDATEWQKLQQSSHPYMQYLNAALADKEGEVVFHLNRKQMTSSIFKPNPDVVSRFEDVADYECVKQITMSAETMDGALARSGIVDADFAKLDTQGSELQILQGATHFLTDHLFGLEIEVEFLEVYKGQPLFSEVEQYVRRFDYEVFDIRPFTWKRRTGKDLGGPYGQLAFGDALFFKTVPGLAAMLDRMESADRKRAKVIRAVTLCLLYGYADYALDVYDSQRNLFEAKEQESFAAFLKGLRRSSPGPDFRGRWRLAQIFQRLAEIVDPSNASWSVGRERIGNSR